MPANIRLGEERTLQLILSQHQRRIKSLIRLAPVLVQRRFPDVR